MLNSEYIVISDEMIRRVAKTVVAKWSKQSVLENNIFI